MYVVNDKSDADEIVDVNRKQWDSFVAFEIEKQLKITPYITGNQLTGADIMLGWSLWIANTLGWTEKYPNMLAYLKRLSNRSAFKKAFCL
jgi:glutathione S-transferase